LKKRIISILFLIFSLCTLMQGNSAHLRADASPQIKVTKKSYFVRPKSWVWWHHPGFPKSTALNTDTGETLVIWQEANSTSTFGRILKANGAATNKKFKISSPAFHYGCGAAYNPATKEYLVLYTLEDHGSVLGMRFDSNAKAIGKEFTVLPETLTEIHQFPSPIFNPQTNGYILLSQRTDGIAGVLLDESGEISSNSVLIKKNPGTNGYYDDAHFSRILGAVLLPSGNKLLVLIQQRSSEFEFDYFLGNVDPMLKKVKSAKKINAESVQIPRLEDGNPRFFTWGATLAALPDGSAAVFYADHKSVNRRQINQNGKLSGPPSPAFSNPLSPTSFSFPRVAFSTTAKGTSGLLIVSENSNIQDPHFEWAQALDANGRSVGDPIGVYEFPAYDTPGDSSLLALPRKPSDTLFQFEWIQPHYLFPPGEDLKGSILNIKLEVQP